MTNTPPDIAAWPRALPQPKPLPRLKARREFLRAAKGRRQPTRVCLIQKWRRGDDDPAIRVGFTVTKKIGGAVLRNRIKRRLRAAADAALPLYGEAGCDYVLVARPPAARDSFNRLLDDIARGLVSLRQPQSRKQRAPRKAAPQRRTHDER